MAFKITNLGGGISPDESQPINDQNVPEESWSEFATRAPQRIATQAIPRAISGAIGIPAGIAAFGGQVAEKALSPFLGNKPEIQEFEKKHKIGQYGKPAIPYPSVENVYAGQAKLLKKIGVPEHLLEQKPGFIEGTANRAITALPYVALLPGSIWANAGRELTASAGGQAAEEAGFGPEGQLVGSLIGGYAGSKAVNKVASKYFQKGGTIENLEKLAEKTESQLYSKQKKLGEKSVSAPKYQRQLNQLYNEIVDDSGIPSTTKNELIEKMKTYEQDIAGGKLKPNKLAERTKQINSAYKFAKNSNEKNYLKRIQKEMFEEADRIGKSRKQWYKSYSDARSIGRAQSYKLELPEMIDETPKLLKFIPNRLAQAVVGVTGALGANKGGQILGFLSESPQTRQLLQQAIEQTLNRNIPALEKTYREINKRAEQFEKKNKQDLKGKFIITKT